jgi:hypothetical protein
MNELSLKLAQKDIDEALKIVEEIQKELRVTELPELKIKGKFLNLSEKVEQLENILKKEGIID